MVRKTNLLFFAGIFIGIAAGVAFFFGLNAGNAVPSTDINTTDPSLTGELLYAPEKGALAPDFELEDLSGNLVHLTDLRGKVVLLNFWATWCGPCRIEMPALQSRHEQLQDTLELVAIDFDEPKENVQAFAEEFGLTFKVLLDPGAKVQDLNRVRGYPTSIFLDPDGVVRIVQIGVMTEGQLDDYLQQMGALE